MGDVAEIREAGYCERCGMYHWLVAGVQVSTWARQWPSFGWASTTLGRIKAQPNMALIEAHEVQE